MKTGAVIQARMQSTRLPGKVLMPLPFPSGQTILRHIIERCNSTKRVDDVIIATSVNPENDAIADLTGLGDCKVFRGSEENVLERFYLCCEQNKIDVVIRLTADNPCIDPVLLDQMVEHHIANRNDYTKSTGLPIGMNFEIISFSALKRSFSEATTEDEKEHVTPYIIKNPSRFKTEIVPYETLLSSLRLTVDYPSDYALMSLVFSQLADKPFFGLKEIEQVFQDNPWLRDINSGNFQKKTFASIEEELYAASEQLDILEMFRASAIIKDQLK